MTAADRLSALEALDAETLCARAETALSALVEVMNRETTFLRAGHVREATALTAEKTQLAQDYVTLARAIQRAAASDRLLAYQVCDWNLPLAAEPLNSRGYMGDGFIDFPSITRMIKAAGYTGDIEVEIFNEDVWATPADESAKIIAERFEQLVLPHA